MINLMENEPGDGCCGGGCCENTNTATDTDSKEYVASPETEAIIIRGTN